MFYSVASNNGRSFLVSPDGLAYAQKNRARADWEAARRNRLLLATIFDGLAIGLARRAKAETLRSARREACAARHAASPSFAF